MAWACAVAGLEEELTCPICLGIYSTPVSLSCGHSFCRECIQEARDLRSSPRRPFSCPLCGAQEDSDIELLPNVQLRSIVQKFRDAHPGEEEPEGPGKEEEGSSGQQDKVIPCDFCLQDPQPAVKTCLSCEASLCHAHLSKHNAKSTMKDHVLMEPCDAQDLAQRRCPQHGRVLECYCKTDAVCICVLCCVTGSHKSHNIITLEEAFGQAQSALAETLEEVKAKEAALDQSIANLLKKEEEVKTTECLRRDQLESLFEKMRLQLDNKKGEVLQVLSCNKEEQLSQIQTQIGQCKKEKDSTSCYIQKLEALRDEKDMLLFNKAFAAISNRKCTEVPEKADVILQMPPITLNELTTDYTLRLFQQFLSDIQSLLKAPPVHEHLTVCNSTFGVRNNIVSASSRYHPQPLEKYSRRASAAAPMRSQESFSNGCHFWEVDTSNASCWELGIVCGSFECCLRKSNDRLCVTLPGQIEIVSEYLLTVLRVVRVEVDCGRNTLSFYDASLKAADPAKSLRLIQTVSIPSNRYVQATFSVSHGFLTLL